MGHNNRARWKTGLVECNKSSKAAVKGIQSALLVERKPGFLFAASNVVAVLGSAKCDHQTAAFDKVGGERILACLASAPRRQSRLGDKLGANPCPGRA